MFDGLGRAIVIDEPLCGECVVVIERFGIVLAEVIMKCLEKKPERRYQTMHDIEADLLKDGWEEFDDEECGDFTDDEYGGLARFKWGVRIDKIELPDSGDVGSAVGKMLGLGDPDDPDAQPNANQPGGGILGMWMGGAAAMGGMAAFTPGSTRELREEQTRKVVEDKEFFNHDGVNVRSLIRATLSNFASGVMEKLGMVFERAYRLEDEGVDVVKYRLERADWGYA